MIRDSRPFATLLLPLLLLLSPAPAAAADAARDVEPPPSADVAAEEPPKSTWSDRIVVTASRGERAVRDVPLHAIVLDPQAPTAAGDFGASDLVARQVPSLNLHVAASSLVSAPRDQSLNFRGAGAGTVSRALLLVDGLPMLDPYNASAIWSKTPKALIERVEVVPGGGATVWGNLALSGVVNLITRPPAEQALDLEARLAERATVGATAILSDLAGGWAGWLAADHFATDGYSTVETASRGAADEPEFRDYNSLTARASYTLSPRAALHLRALGYGEDRGEGTRLDRAENREWMAAASADVTGKRAQWQFHLFGRRQQLDDFNGELDAERATVVPSAHIFDLASENLGAGAVWSRPVGERHAVTAGADFQYLAINRDENLVWDGTGFTERYHVEGRQQLAGGFVEGRWRPDRRWSVLAAARLDAIRTYDGHTRRTELASGIRSEDERLDDNTETTANPSLGFVFQATAVSRVRGAVYTGFRGPAPSELFVGAAPRNNRVTVPNPDLRPEALLGAELGYDFTPAADFSLRATGFWSETDDLIQRVTLGRVGADGGNVEPCGELGPRGACQQRQNLGTTRAYGVELGADFRPHPRWRLELGAALLDTEVTDNPADPDLVGREIELTPGERLTLGATYLATRLTAALRLRRIGNRWAETENENHLPAQTLVDLTVSHRLSERFEIFAGAENLLDEEPRIDFSSGIFRVGSPRVLQLGLRFQPGLDG
jgi:outer membrane receptor protein involved in Fe transport